jgi:type I restriction enzyme M protein
VLFIDARRMGRMVDRVHRELTDEEVQNIARTYHAWRGEHDAGQHQDIPGFCKKRDAGGDPPARVRSPRDDMWARWWLVGHDKPFDETMRRLTAQLRDQIAMAGRLAEAIWRSQEELRYDA